MVKLIARLLYPLYREIKILYGKEYCGAKMLYRGDPDYVSLDNKIFTAPATPVISVK